MVAVEEISEVADGEGNVGVGSHSNVIEAANKGTVWHAVHPHADLERWWDGRVRVVKFISKKEHSLPCLTGFLPCRCLTTLIVSTLKVIKGINFCKTIKICKTQNFCI